MALTPVTFSITDDSMPSGIAVEGVTVRVYNTAGDTFITQGDTGADGELVLDLEESTTYWVRFYKIGYVFPVRATIDVSASLSNAFDITGIDATERPPSAVSYLCRASGLVVGAHGAPIAGATFCFTATDLPSVIGGLMVAASKVYVMSDSDGYVEVELVRGGTYDVLAEGHEDEVLTITVPDSASCGFTDLVFPYVARVDWSPSSISVAVGESAEVDITVTLSSGATTPYDSYDGETVGHSTYVQASIEDESIISCTGFEEGSSTLEFTGLTAGTTSVTVTLVDGATKKRLPTPTSVLNSLSVTVT